MKNTEAIYGKTFESAKEFLHSFQLNSDEFVLKRNKEMVETNHRILKVVAGNDSSRGIRVSKAYVDENLPIKFLKVVNNSVQYSDLPLDKRISYFG